MADDLPHDHDDDPDTSTADDDMSEADPGATEPGGASDPDGAAGEPAIENDEDAIDESSSGEDAEPEEPAEVRLTMRSINERIIGTVVLHYAPRDVHLALDGASAMRLLTAFRQRREGGLGDDLSRDSPAYNGWFVLDLGEPLAMSWMPASPRGMRTAIDPVVELAAP